MKQLTSKVEKEILALIRQSKTRERGFALLLDTYQESLYWHIRRLTGNHEDANDVVQNCLLKVYRNIGSFRSDARLYTWLFRIATNEAVTFLRKKDTAHQHHAVLSTENRWYQKAVADPWFSGDDTQKMLLAAISRLPEKQRIVFNLRYFEEMPYQKMAEVLDTSVGGLKANYHHAVKKIEAFIKAKQL